MLSKHAVWSCKIPDQLEIRNCMAQSLASHAKHWSIQYVIYVHSQVGSSVYNYSLSFDKGLKTEGEEGLSTDSAAVL